MLCTDRTSNKRRQAMGSIPMNEERQKPNTLIKGKKRYKKIELYFSLSTALSKLSEFMNAKARNTPPVSISKNALVIA